MKPSNRHLHGANSPSSLQLLEDVNAKLCVVNLRKIFKP